MINVDFKLWFKYFSRNNNQDQIYTLIDPLLLIHNPQ